MKTDKKMHFEYIQDSQELSRALKSLKKASRIALDTEADSFHHYYPKVCLIQLSTSQNHYIIDPLVNISTHSLLEVLSQKPLIIHDAAYDLRMLKADFNFIPQKPIFDTMLAGRLLGYEKIGLASLVDRFFSVHIPKTHQRADWSKRPLPDELLLYAIEDTRYLLGLAEILEEKLRDCKRFRWHNQSCQQAVRAAIESEREPEQPDAWRIKGTSTLSRRQMTFVRQLWYWRQKEAQKADLPSFRIMFNTQLLKVALWAAGRKNPLNDKLPKLPRHCTGIRLKHLKKAIQKAIDTPRDQWQSPKKSNVGKKPDPVQIQQTEAIRKKCQQLAHSLDLPSQVIVSRAVLGTIVRKKLTTVQKMTKHNLLLPWQAELLEPIVQETIQ